jgi:hypothetical protein
VRRENVARCAPRARFIETPGHARIRAALSLQVISLLASLLIRRGGVVCAASGRPHRREPVMSHFIDCLLSNLALLALVHASCWIARRLRPGLVVRGTPICLALLATALAFDAALTFLVFADAGGVWRQYDPRASFPARAAAYALAAVLAVTAALLVRLRGARRPAQANTLTIETSPWSQSSLPM